jgi:hypothetical protein
MKGQLGKCADQASTLIAAVEMARQYRYFLHYQVMSTGISSRRFTYIIEKTNEKSHPNHATNIHDPFQHLPYWKNGLCSPIW